MISCRILSLPLSTAIVIDLLPRLARLRLNSGVTVDARTELRLTDDESAAFWPLYETSRAESDAVRDRYAALIKEYVRRYDAADLTDEYADRIIDEYFDIQKDRLGVQEEFLPRFREVMPALKVARFYQLEHKTNAEIDAQLALVIPLNDPS